ncbi:MAG: hypothetical protein HC877_01275 [Thioploca sp.]|nr:hypothetical protein [Thioploca sp.]
MISCYSILLSGYAQAENTFINQTIVETELAALENTEIKIIQVEAMAAENAGKLWNKTLLLLHLHNML